MSEREREWVKSERDSVLNLSLESMSVLNQSAHCPTYSTMSEVRV